MYFSVKVFYANGQELKDKYKEYCKKMYKSIGQRNMERYRQYEQECRDKGDDVKADLIRQAAKTYSNSFIEDFVVIPPIFPVCSVQYADDITKLGRKKMFNKTMDAILNTK